MVMSNKLTPLANRHLVASSSKSNGVVKPSHNRLFLFHSSDEFTQTSPTKPLPHTVSDICQLVAAQPTLHSLKTLLSSSVEEACPLDSPHLSHAVKATNS